MSSTSTTKKQAETTKGCRVCVGRRIRCDLQRPFCQKCIKKGLACPGYGPRIKWVGGVAARGRLRGRKIPSFEDEDAENGTASTSLLVAGPSSTASTSVFGAGHIAGDDVGELGFFAGLIEYYGKSIAGLMVWLDGEQNDYRRRVLPLAKSEPGLRLAVAAMAAHHGSSVFPNKPANFAELARDACLDLVKQAAKEMTARLTTGSGLGGGVVASGGEWVLASVLIMICFEMVRSRLEVAECHKQAARTIVEVLGPTEAGHSQLFRFLQNQLAIHDVLASTTSFDLEDVQRAVTPPANSETTALFADYLTSLHQVTLASRRPRSAQEQQQMMSASSVRAMFEQARGSTLMAAGRLCGANTDKSRDLVHLAEVYHMAALLYSYRCMGLETLDAVTYAEHHILARRLPDELLRFGGQHRCIQNLPWPALVAGFECHADGERQAKVVKVFLDIYEATRFGHYLDILEFLQTFWAGPRTDWPSLAREWELAGRRIIPV